MKGELFCPERKFRGELELPVSGVGFPLEQVLFSLMKGLRLHDG